MNYIRKAEERDIPRILSLLLQVNMVHHNIRPDLFKGPAVKYDREELCKILKSDDRLVFVFDEGKGAEGYIFCEIQQHKDSRLMTDIRTLYIDDLCVDETSRGKRIGHRLYEYVYSLAKVEGFYNITLNVWHGNDGAEHFYESLGLSVQKTTLECIIK